MFLEIAEIGGCFNPFVHWPCLEIVSEDGYLASGMMKGSLGILVSETKSGRELISLKLILLLI